MIAMDEKTELTLRERARVERTARMAVAVAIRNYLSTPEFRNAIRDDVFDDDDFSDAVGSVAASFGTSDEDADRGSDAALDTAWSAANSWIAECVRDLVAVIDD